MTRRLVFAGGIQAKALAKAYRLDAAMDRDEDVFFIGAESMAREAAHRVIAAADVLIIETTLDGATVPEAFIPARATVIGVPLVRGNFLWPFVGRPHPLNEGTDTVPDGPYPADFGDSRLDALLADGVSAEQAVEHYLTLDIGSEIDLDALLESTLRDLVALDMLTGSRVAEFVDDEFRSHNLFATRDRMHLPLFRHMAGRVFDELGAHPARASGLSDTQFPPGTMPIHPSVLRHFGMAVPSPDHRYLFLSEGMFTFEEYCHRYVHYKWNRELHAALALADVNPSLAIPKLRQALETSPGSQAGQLALAQAERAVSDISLLPAPQNSAEEPSMAPVEPASGDGVARQDRELVAPLSSLAGQPVSPEMGWPTVADTLSTLPVFGTGPTLATSQTHEKFDVSPEQQSYVELPLAYSEHDVHSTEGVSNAPGQYEPLAPAQDLIEVLPRMLPSSRGLTNASEGPFSTMPESMPPPPLRPVLPPEFKPELAKRGLLSKLFGNGR